MRPFLLLIVAVVGFIACDEPQASLADAAPDDWECHCTPPGKACDPVNQVGCAEGEKCTWQMVTDRLGRVACVPDGTVATDGACTFLPPGETQGHDDCRAGQYCVDGSCRAVCTTHPDSCDEDGFACAQYPAVFEGTNVSTGVCAPTCEPGPQTRDLDGAAGCGSSPESLRGCYGAPWVPVPTEFVCRADASDAGHGDPPDPVDADGTPYPGSCDAGYFPSPIAPHSCTAFCVPAETHAGAPENADGIAPFSCTDRGAIAPGSMECRYLHPFLETQDARFNGSGMCVDTTAAGIPLCVDLGTDLTDTDDDGVADTPEHQVWGCAPWPE